MSIGIVAIASMVCIIALCLVMHDGRYLLRFGMFGYMLMLLDALSPNMLNRKYNSDSDG